MLVNNHAAHISAGLVPGVQEAVQLFQLDGGHITQPTVYGEDPLNNNSMANQQRELEFNNRYPSFGPFFYKLVNGNPFLFIDGLRFLIHLTKTLSN